MLNRVGLALLIISLLIAVTPQSASNAQSSTTYYITAATANARSCARTNCRVITKFSKGTAIEVTGTTEGGSFQGSTTWLNVNYDGQTVYVHSKLASTTPPSSGNNASSTSASTTSTTSTSSSSSGNVCSQYARPRNCDTAKSYGLDAATIASCWPHLDRDHDGVACYGD